MRNIIEGAIENKPSGFSLFSFKTHVLHGQGSRFKVKD